MQTRHYYIWFWTPRIHKIGVAKCFMKTGNWRNFISRAINASIVSTAQISTQFILHVIYTLDCRRIFKFYDCLNACLSVCLSHCLSVILSVYPCANNKVRFRCWGFLTGSIYLYVSICMNIYNFVFKINLYSNLIMQMVADGYAKFRKFMIYNTSKSYILII